jgi:hypothetical protein
VSWLVSAAVAIAVAAAALYCVRRSSYARGREEALREVAETFDLLTPLRACDRKRHRKERVRVWLQLLLLEPAMRDALRQALELADRHWGGDRVPRPGDSGGIEDDDSPFGEPELEEAEDGVLTRIASRIVYGREER